MPVLSAAEHFLATRGARWLWDEHILDDLARIGQRLDGYIPSADGDTSAFAIAMNIFQRQNNPDPMHCIDWAVTPGRWDVESQEMLENDNAYPDMFFQAPNWFIWPWCLLNRSSYSRGYHSYFEANWCDLSTCDFNSPEVRQRRHTWLIHRKRS